MKKIEINCLMTKIVQQITCATHSNGYIGLHTAYMACKFCPDFSAISSYVSNMRAGEGWWSTVLFQGYFLFDTLPNWLIKIEEDRNVFDMVTFTRNQPLINTKQREYRIQAIINFVLDTVAKWRWLSGTRKTELWIWKYWLWITSPISARLTRFVSAQLPDGWADFKNNHDEIRLMS